MPRSSLCRLDTPAGRGLAGSALAAVAAAVLAACGGGAPDPAAIPASVVHSPPGPNHVPNASEKLWIYDSATESDYVVFADHAPFGRDDVIAIARSLFESPNPR